MNIVQKLIRCMWDSISQERERETEEEKPVPITWKFFSPCLMHVVVISIVVDRLFLSRFFPLSFLSFFPRSLFFWKIFHIDGNASPIILDINPFPYIISNSVTKTRTEGKKEKVGRSTTMPRAFFLFRNMHVSTG